MKVQDIMTMGPITVPVEIATLTLVLPVES